MPCCANESCQPARRRGGLFSFLLNTVVLYLLLVLSSGTLIRTGHPVAAEVGKLIQIVTMVEPAIHFAQSHGWQPVANGLEILANGLPIPSLS